MSDNVIDLSAYRSTKQDTDPLQYVVKIKLPDAGEVRLSESDIEALRRNQGDLDAYITRLRRQHNGTWESADYEEDAPAFPLVGREYVEIWVLQRCGARVIMRCERSYTSPSGRNKGSLIVVLVPVSISRFAYRWCSQWQKPPRDERIRFDHFQKSYRLLVEQAHDRHLIVGGKES